MLRVGLTGGIGSGKTTVAKIFEVLGIPVYYADDSAKHLMHTDQALKAAILKNFGEESYSGSGINRQYLSDIIFNDPEKLQLLNSLVHPVTLKDAEEWMQQQHAVYAIKEAALIFEAGAQKNLDLVIGVTAPQKLRIERIMERDKLQEPAILKRISRQMNEEEKMRLCDFVVENDEEQLLIPQVVGIHQKLLENIAHLHL